MTAKDQARRQDPQHRLALRAALVYALAAALWILCSDALLGLLVSDAGWLAPLATAKGWLFVAVTAALLYALLRRRDRAAPGEPSLEAIGPPLNGRLALLLQGLAILAFTGVAIAYEVQASWRSQVAQVESVAALRSQQVDAWLRGHLAKVRFVAGSRSWAAMAQRWEQGDAAAQALLMARVADLRTSFGDHGALVVDHGGRVVGADGAAPQTLPPSLRSALRAALADGQVRLGAIHTLPESPGKAWFDVVAPLAAAGLPARAAVVLRVDVGATLIPTLQAWPVPARTAATLLVRRDGDRLVGIFGANPLPIATPELFAARVLRGEVAAGTAATGVDFRGRAVIGALLPVAGSDWFLVAKIDRAEVLANAAREAMWIAGAGLLALLGALIYAIRSRDRHLLQRTLAAHAEQGERLRTSALMQAIADGSGDAIFAKDREGRYLVCNREAARLLGAAPEAIRGRDDRALLGPEQARAVMANDADVMRRRALQTFEEPLATPAGERIFLATKGPLIDDQGRVAGVFGIARDITERKRAESALGDRETTLRTLLSSMADGMFVAQDHRFVFVNAAWPRLLGWPSEALVGLPFAAVVAPEHLAAWTQRVEPRAGSGPEPAGTLELQFVRRDGERVWAALRTSRLEFHGRPAVLGVVSDIGEAKRIAAELDRHRHSLQELVHERTRQLVDLNQTLIERERFVRTLADNQPSMLAYWDRSMHCRFANRAFREHFGRSEQEMDGIDALTLLGADRHRETGRIVEALWRGETLRIHRDVVDAAGRRVYGLATYIPDVVDGEVRGFLVMNLDVTPMKEAEQRLTEMNAALLESRDRAEAASRAKSAFLANMSHEIRTPMNAVIGLTHLLLRDADDPLARERLGKVSDAAGHLLQVINDILDLSKIEAGRLELEQTDFSLGALLARAHGLVADRAQAKGLALSYASAPDVPDRLRGDPTRLSQALLNLLGNAVKFTHEGSVTLGVSLLAREDQAVRLRFAVADTGIGIAPDTLGQLFQAFVQGDTSTTRRFGGTGLGLVITQRIATLMDGGVGVSSEPGCGSTFWFDARVQLGGEGRFEPTAAAASRLQGRHAGTRVLLAEDNPVNQDVARELLAGAGLVADVVDDGVAAVEQARRHDYALILMDVQMPVLDGLEATRRIRAIPGRARTPVIAMTANVYDEDRDACLAAGMNDHLGKPVDPEALYGLLLRWLDEVAADDAPPTTAAAPPR